MAKIKDWYKSRTIRVAIIQAIVGLVAVFASEFPEFGGIVLAKSALEIWLRFDTSKPIR